MPDTADIAARNYELVFEALRLLRQWGSGKQVLGYLGRCLLQIGQGHPCIASTGAPESIPAAVFAEHLTAVHTLKRAPLRVFHAQKERQALRVSQQLNAALAACTVFIYIVASADERCHGVASFDLRSTISGHSDFGISLWLLA